MQVCDGGGLASVSSSASSSGSGRWAYATLLSGDKQVLGVCCLLQSLERSEASFPVLVLMMPETKPALRQLLAYCNAAAGGGRREGRFPNRGPPGKPLPAGASATHHSPQLADALQQLACFASTALGSLTVHFVEVQPLKPAAASDQPDQQQQQREGGVSRCLTKLQVFGLACFDRIVFLEHDCLVLRNLDHLFSLSLRGDSPAFAPTLFPPDAFDSGVMVVQPSTQLHQRLLEALPPAYRNSGKERGERPAAAGGETEAAAAAQGRQTLGALTLAQVGGAHMPVDDSSSSSKRRSSSGKRHAVAFDESSLGQGAKRDTSAAAPCAAVRPSPNSAIPPDSQQQQVELQASNIFLNSFFSDWYAWDNAHRLPFRYNAQHVMLQVLLGGGPCAEGTSSGLGEGGPLSSSSRGQEGGLPALFVSPRKPQQEPVSFTGESLLDGPQRRSQEELDPLFSRSEETLEPSSHVLSMRFVVDAMNELVGELAGVSLSDSSSFKHVSSSMSSLSQPLRSPSSSSSLGSEELSVASSGEAETLATQRQHRYEGGRPSRCSRRSLSDCSRWRGDTFGGRRFSGVEFERGNSQAALARELSEHVKRLLASHSFAAEPLTRKETEGRAGADSEEEEQQQQQQQRQLKQQSQRYQTRVTKLESFQPLEGGGGLGPRQRTEGVPLAERPGDVGFRGLRAPPAWAACRPLYVLRFSAPAKPWTPEGLKGPLEVLWWRVYLGRDPLNDRELQGFI
ncbi:hypothetical protein Esti_000588 [Eimeria stiedai]